MSDEEGAIPREQKSTSLEDAASLATSDWMFAKQKVHASDGVC